MAISPLRQRMIDDMTARHFGEKTQKDYIRCVKNLTAYFGRPPETRRFDRQRKGKNSEGATNDARAARVISKSSRVQLKHRLRLG